jgi:hypothetical protein
MNTVTPSPVRRRRIWPWVLGFCLTPFVAVGVAAYSYLTLDRDARILRREVMAATDANWHTKVQVSVGGATLGAVRSCLLFVHHRNIAEARMALGSVKGASVGVYALSSNETEWSRHNLFANADEAMQRRGWTRLVGVADAKETVLIYTSDESGTSDLIDVCLAVVDGRDLVVASVKVDAARLAELVETHAGDDLKRKFHLARLL